MRTARLASILLLASGSVLGLPQYSNQDNTDDAGAAGGSVSGEFWWQQGNAFTGADGGNAQDIQDTLGNIFSQVVSAFNSTVSQVTSQGNSINSITPQQSEYCALGKGCVPWQLCPSGVITQGSNVVPGLVPYPPGAGYTSCGDVLGNVCCGIPKDVLDQQQQQSNAPNVYDTCSAGLKCVAIGNCNLYNGFIEPQVATYDNQPFVNYNICTGDGATESVCCQEKPGDKSDQQTQGSGPYSPGDSSSDALNSQCASNQECVPYFQCQGGFLNTDGAGLLDVRTKPKSTCSHPDYPEIPAICCTDPNLPEPVVSSTYAPTAAPISSTYTPTPAPISSSSYAPTAQLDSCTGYKVCVTQGLCDATGNIITDGGGLLDLRIVHKRCYVDGTTEAGVCCTPPGAPQPTTPLPIPQIEICPKNSPCLAPSSCLGEALNSLGSWTSYASTGKIYSECVVGDGYTSGPGVCCINPIPQIDICPDNSLCLAQSSCLGEALDSTESWTSYAATGKIYSECVVGDGYTGGPGVCCNNPIRVVEICPRESPCLAPSSCSGEVLDNTGSWTSYASTGKIYSECTVGGGYSSGPGVCCINPPPPTPAPLITCSGSQVCVDQNTCDANGNVVTDGAGIFDLRLKGVACYTDVAAYTVGVCCNPPIPVVNTCPGASSCVPELFCTGQVLDSNNDMTAYSSGGTWSQCPMGDEVGVMGVCCINQLPIIAADQCGRRNQEEVLNTRIQSTIAVNEAQFGEFPWQAIIFFSNYTFKCGASLIGDKWLLTGGHCVNGFQPSDIQIRLGEWQVNSFEELFPYKDVQVKGITVHPDFNPKNVQNNIAVLELAEPIGIQYHVNSICLPAPGQTFWNQRCIVSGWGKDSFEGNYQHILKKVEVPIVDKSTCQDLLRKTRLGKWFSLHDSFICAGGEENKDACKGDGGGPLACEDPVSGRYYLAGMTSWGIGCGNKDIPGVYADVQGFSTWIQGIIGGTLDQQQQLVNPEVDTGVNPYGK